MNDVIKTNDVDRRYKNCQCEKCKEVSQCTPFNDFYEVKDSKGLLCELCFRREYLTTK